MKRWLGFALAVIFAAAGAYLDVFAMLAGALASLTLFATLILWDTEEHPGEFQ